MCIKTNQRTHHDIAKKQFHTHTHEHRWSCQTKRQLIVFNVIMHFHADTPSNDKIPVTIVLAPKIMDIPIMV